MKIQFALSLLTLAVMTAVTAKADVGNGIVQECSGKLYGQMSVSFQIRTSALPPFIDGIILQSKNNSVIDQLNCAENESPSQMGSIFSCSSKFDFDGKISVEVYRSEPLGVLIAQVKQDQMYPLPAVVIGSLVCGQTAQP
jgi:hypothetical protein